MPKILVRKSAPLEGSVKIDGAKNAALPIIAASLLGTEPIVLEDVPNLVDVKIILKVLESLGAKVEFLSENRVSIDSSKINSFVTDRSLMEKMRASFLVMGPLLARFGRADAFLPGGCAIGSRPIDLHLKGFKILGALIEEEPDKVSARCEKLYGDTIYLDFPSVGATQNIMMAATLAKGETIIENAAKEPEIVDLGNFLNKMGAKVSGAGTSTIRIIGVEKLGGTVHTIIPDRIEAATFMIAAAITGGKVVVQNCISNHIKPVIAKLKETGAYVVVNEDEDSIFVKGGDKIKGTDIKTLPYPGFPTDVQAQFMAYLCVCEDQAKVTETVFENRFMHVEELNKMGAIIATSGKEARIAGVRQLVGAEVNATDLRAGAALVLAGLVAEGTTTIGNIYHIDRGYNDFVGKMRSLGANIERIED
ncbi:UDP-N-acetylglucosamine 1-carboxyvinyltransferase [Parvimonas sp. D2]|uniref:UDP-N-acetylglucosamine 1-carboxyvinyltransferase n=1 Tax=unclassified Parvimonas TaxID=1151464 RepID=UPI00020DDAB7|nr:MULTISPECIES: UDP-N-acetylglucosamine 1-carboxyvinyltransferase [unclassified Parvimonas]EGL38702.1 UDP-N-acetylglucosamine 1-carboxyvinyltransferase [Parvimonas sp. oral taxon 110 str. F0139]MEB3011667.1 UDP-N-acetylglucosamine 1-carboxyvinyltransferase [Parvimonas sp. D2]MEB3087159.1 UDP-N-acetylglucosamine 1-carboxyvinyltransferase [Parvimonas sp. D4]